MKSPPPGIGKQWRLERETVAADSSLDYATGQQALRTLDAFGTMRVSELFYHHKLMMVPAGTLVAEADAAPQVASVPQSAPQSTAQTHPDSNSRIGDAHKVVVLDGPQTGQTLWLYPESAEKMGFEPATPTP